MKIISALTLIAAAAALVAPNQAMAGDKEKALIGGLIGGIIIGTVIADDDHFDSHVNVAYHHGSRHDHGYWEWVSVKQWVPGYYERSCDRHGHTRKIWISGHYTWVKQKVWVESRRGHGYRNDRHDSRNDHYDRRDRHDDRRDRYSQKPVRRF